MAARTGISWTSATWNPWQGCHKVSPGCRSCYMYQEKERYGQDPGTIIRSKDPTFYAPLKWTLEKVGAPYRVFTCSWSDFFIPEADPWREEAWDIIRKTPWLIYQILSKRPERIQASLPDDWANGWPNVWLGVSVENQSTADARIPWLLRTPAARRFVSYEPALAPVDFRAITCKSKGRIIETIDALLGHGMHYTGALGSCAKLDWIICGGESGPQSRPCELRWLYDTVDVCREWGVACWVKQLGSQPRGWSGLAQVKDRKGANPEEWPEALRVQQFPCGLPSIPLSAEADSPLEGLSGSWPTGQPFFPPLPSGSGLQKGAL